jgi:tetratricopeptide (TPR) repeat protein
VSDDEPHSFPVTGPIPRGGTVVYVAYLERDSVWATGDMVWFDGKRQIALAEAQIAQGIKLGANGQHDASVALFDDVARQHAGARAAELRALAALACFQKSGTLSLARRLRDEQQTLDQLISQFGSDSAPIVLIWVARALFNLACSQHRNGEPDAAIAACRQVAERFLEQPGSEFDEIVCDALANLCVILNEHGRAAEALDTTTTLLARLPVDADDKRAFHRVNALSARSGALSALGRREEALATVGEAIERMAACGPAADHELHVCMLNNQGNLLTELGRLEEAAVAFGAAFTNSRERAEPDTVVYGARALLNKALVLARSGAIDAELETLAALIDRFAGRPDPRLSEVVAQALARSRARLQALGRDTDAQAIDQRIERLLVDMRDADDNQIAAAALMSQTAPALSGSDRLEVLDEIVKGLDRHPGSGLDDLVSAWALADKSAEFARADRLGDAIATVDEALARLASRSDHPALELVAWLLVNRARMLSNLRCVEEAIAGAAEVVSRFGPMRGVVITAAVVAADELVEQLRTWQTSRPVTSAPMTLHGLLKWVDGLATATPSRHNAPDLPHFIHAEVATEPLVAKLQYAAHDPQRHYVERLTGFALLANIAAKIRQELGKSLQRIVMSSEPMVGKSRWPDTNYQLMAENLCVFGLPLHEAAAHTHIGICAQWLRYRTESAGFILGHAAIFHFELEE